MAAAGTQSAELLTAALSSASPALISCSPSKGGLLGDQTLHYFRWKTLHCLPAPAGEEGSAAEPGSNRIPELHKRPPGARDKDSAAEEALPPPRSKSGQDSDRRTCIPFPLRLLGVLGAQICSHCTSPNISSWSQSIAVSLPHRRGQGTARRAVPAQSSAPSRLCFPLGHLPAGKEGGHGMRHSTLLAIREEIQLSAAFQLPSQQPDTSVCYRPVPWLSPAPPGAFPCCERN